MSTRIFSRPTPSHYPAQLDCVRKRLSAPRTGRHMAPRPAPAMLGPHQFPATLPGGITEGVKNSAARDLGWCNPFTIQVGARQGPPPEEGVKEFESVMLSGAKHPCSSSQVLETKATTEILRLRSG